MAAGDATCDRGCDRPAKRGGLCWACVKQHQRYGTTDRHRQRHPSPRACVNEAIQAVANADSEDDSAWKRAWARFRMATLRWRRTNVHKPTQHST